TVFKAKHIVSIGAQAAGEESRASNRGEDFCRGTAESAVARKIAGKGGRDKVGSLIGRPVISMDPLDAAVLVDRIGRRSRPGKYSNLPRRQAGVPSGS